MNRSSSWWRIMMWIAGVFLLVSGRALAADCNGNGVPDEFDVVPNLFGLAAPVAYPVGTSPGSASAADLDGDGDIDLAVADAGSGAISILLNDGTGAFGPEIRIPAAPGPSEVIAADLDGDGDPDLAFWNNASYPDPWGAFVLINLGNAIFAAPVRYNPGVIVKDMAAGDIDGDGDTDLVFIGFSSSITGLLNNGNGTFGDGSPTPFVNLGGSGGVGVNGVTLADVDGDLDLDLVTADAFTYNVSILVNDGSGVFAYPTTFSTTGMPSAVVARDFDADGDPDVATVNLNGTSLTVLANDGSGAFTLAQSPDGVGIPSSPMAADLDGDGDADLVVTSGQVFVFMGNGDGTLASARGFPAGVTPLSAVATDLDRDGRPDLAVANRTGDAVSVLRNRLVAFSRDCNGNLVPDECEPDADADQVPDACDVCPGADDLLDTDRDGTADCRDACAFDPHKTAPGTCGCGLPDLADCSQAPSVWPTTWHDNGRSSRSSVVASQTGVPLYPSRSAGGPSDAGGTPSTAVQSPYGTVYYCNGSSLVAVDPTDGTVDWASSSFGSAPVLGPDGTIYGTIRVGGGTTDPGVVVALHPWGAVKWMLQTTNPALEFSGLAMGADGTVYGGYTAVTQQAPLAYVAKRFAISAEGVLLWEHTGAATWNTNPPAIGPDGALYTVGDDGTGSGWKVMKVSPTSGALIWSVAPTTGITSHPLIADNGLVVVASGGNLPNGVHALDPATGVEVWMGRFDDQTYGNATAPFLLHTGEIGAIWEGKIYRFDPDRGRPIRTVPFPGTVRSVIGVAVGGDNLVYLWHEHQVKAISPFTGAVQFAYVANPGGECLNAYPPTILRDGSIFIGWHRRTYCEDFTGSNHYTTLAPSSPTAVDGQPALSLVVQVAPNPMTSELRFTLTTPTPGHARLSIYDTQGRRVATLLDRSVPAGVLSLDWRGDNLDGRRTAAGTYFYRFTLGSSEKRGKLVLLR